MVGTNFMDELDSGSFYEHIDDLLNFPNDDLDNGLLGASGDCDSFPSVLPGSSPSEALFNYDSFFSGNSASDLSAELSVPYEDIVQLEWLSNFVEDSFSGGGMTMEKNTLLPTKESSQTQFQTSSPVSVLESSSSCSNGKAIPVNHEKRARSKRPRPATFNPRPTIQLISPSSSFTETQNQTVFVPCLVSEYGSNSAESMPVKKAPKLGPSDQPKKKKKTTANPRPSNPGDSNQTQNPSPNPNHPVRKCMHCEITKTPQWRAGPMGPKTLCNACGVRYKSGRLFPEYRPAASPTFIPSIHSNSHKKVAEMRLKCYAEKPEEASKIEIATTSQEPEPEPEPELVPSSDIPN